MITDKLKVLAFSDTHGKDIRHLVERAEKEKVTHVFVCGDWIKRDDDVPSYFVSQFKDKGMHVFLQSGNHEQFHTTDSLAEEYDIKTMHGNGVIYNDVGFFGAGGSTQIGPHLISDEEQFELLKQGFEQVKDAKKKVMLVHEHPAGGMFEFGRFPGSKAVRKAIDEFKPDVVLCGHIHEAAGMEDNIGSTKIINVAKDGKILEF